jgi:hypothetical protein
MTRWPNLEIGLSRAYVLSLSMIRPFLFIVLLFTCLVSHSEAQQKIDLKSLKPYQGVLGGNQTLDESLVDSISIGSMDIDRWARFTSKFGERFSFGLFMALPALDHPYRILSWNLPFYGGALSSGGLDDAGLGADIWLNADTFEDIHPDSSQGSAPTTTVRAGAFQYAEASFSFANLSLIDSPTTIALEAYYTSGPDSNAVSPIWTSDQRVNRYFYARPEAITDSTSGVVLYGHDEFWQLYGVNPSVFGEIAGFLIVEMDTTSANIPDDDDGPLNTSMREKWNLPGSHSVVSNYPNPFNPSTVVRIMPELTGRHDIVVYDLLGRVVARESLQAYTGQEIRWTWNAGGLASGVYHVSVQSGSERWFHTMTLTK